jgi:hypothetical protein
VPFVNENPDTAIVAMERCKVGTKWGNVGNVDSLTRHSTKPHK